jgi:hypothetical protein
MRHWIIYTLMACSLVASARGDQVQPGIYTAIMQSEWISANGNLWQAKVSLENGKNTAKCEIIRFKNGGRGVYYKELWIWDDQSLVQTENLSSAWGESSGNSKSYAATNENGKYIINCKDRESGDCDGSMEPSRYWIITATQDGFTYEAWGVPKGEDQKGTPRKLHCLVFKLKK